ncbi:MAG: efflux RND transporter periplasmic adaptor subunit [Burkholderiaceae bacterium]
MSRPTGQRTAMAAIVAVGIVAGAGVLMTERRGAAGGPRAPEAAASASAGQVGAKSAREAHEVKLDEAQIRRAGIAIRAVGPGSIQSVTQFQGELRFNEDRTAHVVPRLAGVAQAVPANLGDTVRQGQVLAVIASTALSDQRSELLTAQRRHEAARAAYVREKKLWEDKISAEQDYLQARTALQEAGIALRNARQKLEAVGAGGGAGGGAGLNRFEIRAPFAGTIVEKHLAPGEAVKEDASIFTLADLRTVWAEFAVSPKDLEAVRVGRKVVVSSSAFESKAEGTVAYVGALLGERTRTARARATLGNPNGAWRPGLFVTVAVLGDRRAAPLVVGADALQTVDGEPVVFKAVSAGFVPTPVRVGRDDGENVEVLQGLEAGDKVASSNTFILKADLGKSGVAEE